MSQRLNAELKWWGTRPNQCHQPQNSIQKLNLGKTQSENKINVFYYFGSETLLWILNLQPFKNV